MRVVLQEILLVVHLLIALGLVGLVLIQRSEGGGLGMGGGGGGAMMSVRGTANFLSRATGVLAACFMATSIGLAILAGSAATPESRLDVDVPTESAPVEDNGLNAPLSE